jgi:hypothetical protein
METSKNYVRCFTHTLKNVGFQDPKNIFKCTSLARIFPPLDCDKILDKLLSFEEQEIFIMYIKPANLVWILLLCKYDTIEQVI